MAKLDIDINVTGGDDVLNLMQDIVTESDRVITRIDQIDSSADFTHLASNIEIAQHALHETGQAARELAKWLDLADNESLKENAVEAKVYRNIMIDLNKEVEEQARLQARLATQDRGGFRDIDTAKRVAAIRKENDELRKQLNIEKEAERRKAKLIKEGKQRALAAIRVEAKARAAKHRDHLRQIREAKRKQAKADRESLAAIKKRRQLLGGIGAALGFGFAAGGAAGAAVLAVNAIVTSVLALSRAWARMATSAGRSFYEINTKMEKMNILLKTATGSIEGGEQAFKDMLQFAAEAPFSIDSLADSFVKLKTAGLDPLDGTLQTLTDSVAAFGGTSENLRLVSVAIQQMVGKGVISMEELRRQFGEQVPTAMRAMAQGLGMPILDMFDLISKGGLETSRGLEAMLGVLDEWHGGAAKDLMDSMAGAVKLLGQAWTKLMLDLGKSSESFTTMTDVVKGLALAIDKFRESAEGKALIAELANEMSKLFTTLTENPEVIADFFKTMIDSFKLALKLAGWLYDKIVGVVDYLANAPIEEKIFDLAKFSSDTFSGGFLGGQINKAVGDPFGVKGAVDDALNVAKEFWFDFVGIKTQAAKEADRVLMYKNLAKNAKDETEKVISSLDEVNAALQADSEEWHNYANQAADALGKIAEEIKELDELIKEKMLSMQGEEFNLKLGYMDTGAEKNDAIFKEINKLQGEYNEGVAEGTLGWEGQIENLTMIRELIKKMSTDVGKVSKEQVAAAKAQYEYLHRTTRGGKVAGMGDEYREAKEEYFKLYKLQKAGKGDVDAEKNLQAEKLRLLEENRLKIGEIYATQKEALQTQKEKEQENLDFWNEAIKNKQRLLGDFEDTRSQMYKQWMQDNKDIAQGVRDIGDAYTQLPDGSWTNPSGGNPPGKYAGGPVTGGNPYIVGEKGPELFVPNKSGTIVPNDQMGGSQTNVSFNFNGRTAGTLSGSREAANNILNELAKLQGAMS